MSSADPGEVSTRLLVTLPTGAGKSLCFMVPPLIAKRKFLILYPLLALLYDQERRLKDSRIPYGLLHGGLDASQKQRILNDFANGRSLFLLATPEAIESPTVCSHLLKNPPDCLVVDEAHLISQWGKDFRPAYGRIGEIALSMGARSIAAFSATVGPAVKKDIEQFLFGNQPYTTETGDMNRSNIRYVVYRSFHAELSLRSLCRVKACQRPIIIFCARREQAEYTARQLIRSLGDKQIRFYHAGLSSAEKRHIETWFQASDDGILSTTCAYGMGVDKKNVRTVIHLELPSSVEAFLQESGRAGRDKKPAISIYLDSRLPNSGNQQKVGRQAFEGYAETRGCRRQFLFDCLEGKNSMNYRPLARQWSVLPFQPIAEQYACCDRCSNSHEYGIAAPLVPELFKFMEKRQCSLQDSELAEEFSKFLPFSVVSSSEVRSFLRMTMHAGLLKKSRFPLWYGTMASRTRPPAS